MANLVSPGYNRSTLISQTLRPEVERTIEFKGLDRKPVIEDGEMSDMWNLTSENYPLLTPRKPRGEQPMPDGAVVPFQIMFRYNKLALIARDSEDSVNFYYGSNKIDAVNDLTETSRMIAINNKICFFPQKTYLEVTSTNGVVSVGNYGKLEEEFEANSLAITVTNEHARIDLGALANFKYDDAINIDGTLTYSVSGETRIADAKVSCIIENVSSTSTATTITLPRETFIELTGEGAENITLSGDISRTMPNFDHVIEWNNRLWGASNNDNTIYACKLGDPTNWQYFQGTSLDSFYAQQGTDGIFTGVAPYSSHIIFFKQNSMTRIYGTSPATFQISNTQCFGCMEGSKDSVTVINDKVFYNSVIGIMCYDGGTPYCVSDKLQKKWKTVIGGQDGNKYYASVKSGNEWELMVLDIDKAVWHKEDDTHFVDTATIDNRLHYLTRDKDVITVLETGRVASETILVGEGRATSGSIGVINPKWESEEYGDYEWMATFGPFDEFIENRKIYSRLLMRLESRGEAEVKVYISENEGPWELVKAFDPTRTGGDYIPIIPRRCDRYSVKIEGKGNCSIRSLTRKVRMGTGGRL